MPFKISKIALFLFLLISIQTVAQRSDDAEKQRKEYEEKAKEDLDKRIQSFLVDLQIDDFQKEIVKQKLQSYFQERKKIYLDASLKYFERDEQLKVLPETHFSDIENLISEDTMQKIQSFVKDGGEELKKKKKKKKKKNNKNKKEE